MAGGTREFGKLVLTTSRLLKEMRTLEASGGVAIGFAGKLFMTGAGNLGKGCSTRVGCSSVSIISGLSGTTESDKELPLSAVLMLLSFGFPVELPEN